jgi:hypothetical protein
VSYIAVSRAVRPHPWRGSFDQAFDREVRRSQRRELRKGTTHVLQRQHDVRPICENLIPDPWIRHSKEIKEPSVEQPWGQYQGRILVIRYPQEPAEKKSVATKWAFRREPLRARAKPRNAHCSPQPRVVQSATPEWRERQFG